LEIWLMSLSRAGPAPGYWILTATSRPSFQTPRTDLGRQHLVDDLGRQRGGAVLQLGEHHPVGRRELLGKGRLEDRQRLPELHRAALELPQHLEELLGRAGLQLGGDELGRLAPHPLAEAEGGAPGEAQRQRGQLGRSGHGIARKVTHPVIVTRAGSGA